MIDAGALAEAEARLEPVVFRTPAVPARWLSELVGGPVYLKCENLQRTGSFKVRGAYNRIAGLSSAQRANGVVAASAGNHAQGVALAASLLEVDATVFMPEGHAMFTVITGELTGSPPLTAAVRAGLGPLPAWRQLP